MQNVSLYILAIVNYPVRRLDRYCFMCLALWAICDSVMVKTFMTIFHTAHYVNVLTTNSLTHNFMLLYHKLQMSGFNGCCFMRQSKNDL
jgi:hypothetical protein